MTKFNVEIKNPEPEFIKPIASFRWLIKKDGTKILQQAWQSLSTNKITWIDIEEVIET